MKHYDFLGQELFDGDEVVTIRKNGRAVGGSLTKAIIKIENGKLGFYPEAYNYQLYSRDIGSVCVKVNKEDKC